MMAIYSFCSPPLPLSFSLSLLQGPMYCTVKTRHPNSENKIIFVLQPGSTSTCRFHEPKQSIMVALKVGVEWGERFDCVAAHLLILAGTFSEDMITTGISLSEDEPWTREIKHAERQVFRDRNAGMNECSN
jgi:hypothetical protein